VITFHYTKIINTGIGEVFVNEANEGLYICHHGEGDDSRFTRNDDPSKPVYTFEMLGVELELELESFTLLCCYPVTARENWNVETVDLPDEVVCVSIKRKGDNKRVEALSWTEQKQRWIDYAAAHGLPRPRGM
jgi:hypothetical protein